MIRLKRLPRLPEPWVLMRLFCFPSCVHMWKVAPKTWLFHWTQVALSLRCGVGYVYSNSHVQIHIPRRPGGASQPFQEQSKLRKVEGATPPVLSQFLPFLIFNFNFFQPQCSADNFIIEIDGRQYRPVPSCAFFAI